VGERVVRRWQDKWALVTGASSGIGRALATELAAGGAHLALVARRRNRLTELATTLAARYNIRTKICAIDLAEPEAAAEIFAFTQEKGIAIELLVNNAGFGAYGEFSQIGLRPQLEMVQVNIAAVVHLTHLYLQPMIERRSGDVLILSSTAAFQAVPYMTTYAATKAFDLLFAEALAEEVAQYGIGVCALCPGSTASEFHEVAKSPKRAFRREQTAEAVAHKGLFALACGRSYVISGLGNYLSTQTERLAPRRFVTRTAAKMFRPRPGEGV
jgi:hypothetical protein